MGNMTSYQIAPYIFRAKIRGENPGVSKPLANIDGGGTSLAKAVSNVLAAMLQRQTDYQDRVDPNKQFLLSSVWAKEGAAYLLRIEPGRKGLQSTLRQAGSVVSRTVGDVEYVPLRHLIYFPPMGHTGIIFAERHGRYGAVSFLRASLLQVLSDKFTALTFSMPPLTTLEALEAATYNKVIFQAPKRRDASGRLLDYGPRVRIDVGFRGRRSVGELVADDGSKIDAKKVFGILSEEGSEAGIKAPLDTKGWDALLSVTMANGRPRTFKLGGLGPALLYPVNGATVNGTLVSASSYPSDEEFIGVCQTVLDDISGQFDVQAGQRIPARSDLQTWNGADSTPWEVTYYDSP
jgi:hypothetical protein